MAHDLRVFDSSPDAVSRLETSISRHNIGPPYLTEPQAFAVLHKQLHEYRSSRPHTCDGSCTVTLGTFLDMEVEKVVD